MKAVLVALVVFAAVLGAQASHLADLSTVAVLESGLKSFKDGVPGCLIGLVITAAEGLGSVGDCFRSDQSDAHGPLGTWACVVSNVVGSVMNLGGVLYQCVDH
ncbi:4-hydroxy-tetrahydrodipicolinate reductase [Frankliniella fusca]|uniref:4-hydroxy-tetrahydrodipicolinate reductase n=1 Tax=Frankliniella fusca TaxID=407009 RepID=A0AAE1HV42_9NEOP|nr:4-hydroxy-tetrahydrodipicolinate reductase [Frankliniella fusca]